AVSAALERREHGYREERELTEAQRQGCMRAVSAALETREHSLREGGSSQRLSSARGLPESRQCSAREKRARLQGREGAHRGPATGLHESR
ncbi:hypothetical protein NDU88_001880, partial [Pleurodeles waltl]